MLKQNHLTRSLVATALLTALMVFGVVVATATRVEAAAGDPCSTTASGQTYSGTQDDKGVCTYVLTDDTNLGKKPGDPGVVFCGDPLKNAIVMSIDIGCKHKGNAILDALFAIIRFLTIGVSLVIIASMIGAGLQYTASRGDPQGTSAAMKRMGSNAGALLLFIFAYAILNWIVPNTLLQ